jgi:hypothetical protein
MAKLSIARDLPNWKEHQTVRRLSKNQDSCTKLLLESPVEPGLGEESSASPTYDAISVTSDEGASDSLLPRVIKPRKRRKKDRKPSGSSTASEDSKKDGSPQCRETSDGKTFVTLKPYVPNFYDVEATNKDYNSLDLEEEVVEQDDCQGSATEPSSCKSSVDLGSECNIGRICGCDKCVTSHDFPTPPSSPSSASSYSSKNSSNVSPCEGDRSSSSVLSSSSGSDDEAWP